MAARVQHPSPLYPSVKPYRRGFLLVGGRHRIYFEETGNPNGKPAVFLHGGPGAGTEPKMRRFFDPRKYRIVLFDQRGCGVLHPSICSSKYIEYKEIARESHGAQARPEVL